MTATLERDLSPSSPGGEPRSLPELLSIRAAETPNRVALRSKELGRWVETSWSGYAERVAHIAAGLRELGVQAGDRVAVHSENRIEWLLADLAVQGMGAVTVGIYPTSPADEVEYLLSHSESVALVAEDEEQYDKAIAVRGRLPALRSIIVMDPRGVDLDAHPGVRSFASLEELGSGHADALDQQRRSIDTLDSEAPAIIVYTSGTTGPPKGAMLSHRNLLAVAETATAAYGGGPDDEVLSYLPLCHIAERLISCISALRSGYVVNFGEGGPSFGIDMREVQPTFFLGVPRVWEKMLASVEIRIADATWLKRRTYRLATSLAAPAARRRMRGGQTVLDRLRYGIAWLLAFRSLRDKLGLGRIRVALSGAAPIAPQVLEFFWTMGVPIREAYGQTENSALCTFMPADDVRLGTVGKPAPGCEVRIAEDGEILTRSAGVFVGYLKNPEATAETVDVDGWLHTGDIGELDDGFLRITDRKKDIIITAGGKNISPSEIENKLKVSPFVREAVVIGDRRKYLTALIGIEFDTVGDWATRERIPYTTYEDLSRKPEVVELIGGVVDEVNGELAQVETIKRFTLLPKELDAEEGELTATQKVKRAALSEQFGELIEAMYR
ncbi:MAG: AMP-binding protein [Actinomycetota bacterium]|nr:AMP-binding protein [Actinomycetota bacterium]